MKLFGRCLLALFRRFSIGRTPTRPPALQRPWQGNGVCVTPPSETDSSYATLKLGETLHCSK
jgi:hypothetical protein